ncbi:MAG: AmmeMemoRadiSam system protein B [Nanoarchaeota archaeon]
MRQAVVAGQFYEGEEEQLREQVRNCFLDKRGPGSLPTGKTNELIRGAIVPHAGLEFSGACAAHVYHALIEGQQPDVYVILGPNHTGMGRSSVLLDDFQTPMGIAKVDKEFGEALLDNTQHLNDNPSVHALEHSIEVQLPFLQFSNKEFRFVPIVISTAAYIEEIAEGIRKAAKQLNRRVCVIASSDFTHYGMSYGYMPFTERIRDNIEKLDMAAVEFITRFDAAGLHSLIRRTGATICGYLPIMTLLKTLEKGEGKQLCYYTSGDVTGDNTTSVSYVGMTFS